MKLQLTPVTLRLRRPIATAHGTIAERRVWRVALRAGALVGQGEAAPLPAFGTESAEACVAALERFELTALPDTLEAVARATQGLVPTPAARCAVECALLDLLAQRRGVLVAELLAGEAGRAPGGAAAPSLQEAVDGGSGRGPREAPSPRNDGERPDELRSPQGEGRPDPDPAPLTRPAADLSPLSQGEVLQDRAGVRGLLRQPLQAAARAPRARLEVGALIEGEDAEALAQAAREAVAAGYGTLKVKVAARPLAADAQRLFAVRRAVGEGVRLRIDANGGWTEATARSALRGLEALRLELCEQPVPAAGVESLRLLRRQVPCRLAADEALIGPDAAARLARILERDPEVAADALVLKPMALGGLLPALELARAADAAGVACYVTTLIDGPLARAAAAHLAAALPGEATLAHGLGTLELFEGVAPDAFTPERGTITLPRGAGWGLAEEAAGVPDPVRAAAERRPDGVALTWSSASWTWAQLDACVGAWAGWLRGLGVSAGDRVATLCWNRPELVVLFHALGRLGVALVPLNPRLAPVELERLRGRAGAKLTLLETAPATPWPGSRLLGEGPALGGEPDGGRQPSAPSPRDERLVKEAPHPDPLPGVAGRGSCSPPSGPGAGSPRTIAAALFTSGTTGEPRLIELTHARFLASAAASGQNLGAHPSQRWLGTLPLFHVGGLAMAYRCAVYAARLDLEPGFDAARVCAQLDAGATHVSLVPTTLERLLDARGDRPFPSTVEAALIGGGPASPALLARARRLGLPALQTYGLTEACSQVTTERPAEADGTTAGPALPGLELRIAGADPAGVGEILVRGSTVVAPDGAWLATGDLGSLDARGRLTVHARRTDLIVTGGENVMPLEVERALAQHPAIREVAVTARADAHWGQVPVALVVLREPVEAAAVLSWARARLAAFKVPREIRAVEALPRNPMGKLDRHQLRRLAE